MISSTLSIRLRHRSPGSLTVASSSGDERIMVETPTACSAIYGRDGRSESGATKASAGDFRPAPMNTAAWPSCPGRQPACTNMPPSRWRALAVISLCRPAPRPARHLGQQQTEASYWPILRLVRNNCRDDFAVMRSTRGRSGGPGKEPHWCWCRCRRRFIPARLASAMMAAALFEGWSRRRRLCQQRHADVARHTREAKGCEVTRSRPRTARSSSIGSSTSDCRCPYRTRPARLCPSTP